MRHVDHQIGADRIGDRAKTGEIDDPRIGAAAGDDQLGPMRLGDARSTSSKSMRRVLGAHAIGRRRRTTCPTGWAARRASDGRRRPATCRGSCRPAPAGRGTPPGSPAPRNAAGHWRRRIGTAAWRARSPAARRHRRTRSRRNSGGRDSPRRICWSAPSPAPRAPRARRCSRWRSARSATAGGRARLAIAAASSGSAIGKGVARRSPARRRLREDDCGRGIEGSPLRRGNGSAAAASRRLLALYHISTRAVSRLPQLGPRLPEHRISAAPVRGPSQPIIDAAMARTGIQGPPRRSRDQGTAAARLSPPSCCRDGTNAGQ